jgi:hypothetical protein
MLTTAQNVVFWTIIFTIGGAVWYNYDRRYGASLYRWWYNLTHKDKLPEDVSRGFIYKQSMKTKTTVATVVSSIQSLLLILSTEVNLLEELFMWVFEVPITLFGFYLGPIAYSFWKAKDKWFETIDRVESGDVNIAEEAEQLVGHTKEVLVHAVAERIVAPAREKVGDFQEAMAELVSGDDEPPKEVVESEKEEEVDHQSLIDAYKNRRT